MTKEERAQEIQTAFSLPENVALLNQLVDAFNYLYDQNGLNVIVQVHSIEDENGRRWVALVEDNHTIDGTLFRVTVTPDKNISDVEVIEGGIN